MKKFLKILLGILVIAGLVYAALMFFTSGSRDIAKQFVLLNGTGDHAAAHALLHPELQKQFTIPQLTDAFAGDDTYTDVSFSSVSTGGGVTELQGVATTANECSSTVAFEILKGQIISFNVSPVCR
ncbi:hypothetical protein MWU54_17800 [Marivita sp. S6314]|uniref:hypothetical protein n=1 Tax=Marivita sp. S6314 TaxID=2926406 RepID=UPI001FF20CA3|nr:hypothetical protein [Marivita sp. S6314]MCK0151902.1 hypothetical protein [Marivita sp. S6314]